MQKIKDLGEWLLNYIPPKPKVVYKVLQSFKNKIRKIYEKRDNLFQPAQTKSALRILRFSIEQKDQMVTTQNHFCITLRSLLQTLW